MAGDIYKMMARGFIGGVISLLIMAVVITDVFLPQINGTNQTGWTSGEIALWGLVTLVSIAGFLYSVASIFGLV